MKINGKTYNNAQITVTFGQGTFTDAVYTVTSTEPVFVGNRLARRTERARVRRENRCRGYTVSRWTVTAR